MSDKAPPPTAAQPPDRAVDHRAGRLDALL